MVAQGKGLAGRGGVSVQKFLTAKIAKKFRKGREGINGSRRRESALYSCDAQNELFFFDFDTEGFQELKILIVDLKFGVGRECGDDSGFIRGFVALLADPDRGFKDQKNIVAAFLNAGDDFGDLFGV